MTQFLQMAEPFNRMPPSYSKAMEFVVNLIADHTHDRLHRRKHVSSEDFIRIYQNSLAEAFEAGAIWRDFHIETPMTEVEADHDCNSCGN
jgi:hypothetical protein